MIKLENLYQKYCKEDFDEHGVLKSFEVNCPDDFNFGYDVVDKIAELEPNRRALVWCNVAGEERSFSFGELKELSDKCANYFLSQGIKKGDKVMLILKRHYEYWYTTLALHKIGAVVIPATHLLTVKDVIYRVEAANIKAIVCTGEGEIADAVLEAQKQCPQLKQLYMVRGRKKGFVDFAEQIKNADANLVRVDVKSTDTLLMYFTSGTTGYPKMVTHDQSYPIAHIVTAKYWHNVVPEGLHLTVADTGWAKAAWGKIYGQWFVAAGIFVYDFDKFIPEDLLSIIEKYKITTFCAPPTIYRFFIKGTSLDKFDLSSIQHATCAGEALNEEVFWRFKEKTGLEIMEGFGQTETTAILANLVNSQTKPGSMGKPTPLYNVDLVDKNLKPVEPGEIGEMVVYPNKSGRQYGIFTEYYKDEALYKYVWQGGMYHTGDTAYKDKNGYFWYVGRNDDLIKSSGYRIGPFEVESVLIEHPAVLECAVTGIPDEVRGQLVKATIVLTEQYKNHNLDELVKELQTHVKNTTAPYKYPRVIQFVEELPKTISGKIRRVEIREKDQTQVIKKH